MAEDRNLSNNNASTSAAAIPFEEDADEDEEMIFVSYSAFCCKNSCTQVFLLQNCRFNLYNMLT